jgi:hypothetical protein
MACAEAETFRTIDELLGKMRPLLRQAFTMAYYDELSVEEAGALLGVTAGTFKSRVFRARQHLIRRTKRSLVAPIRCAAHAPFSSGSSSFTALAREPSAFFVSRSRARPDLRLSTDRIDEAVYAVLMRLAASSASATFSYSCRDTREFRETHASWIMLQAFRLQQGDATLSYNQMKAALGEPKSAVPDDRQTALFPCGWWLRSIVGIGECAQQNRQRLDLSRVAKGACSAHLDGNVQ